MSVWDVPLHYANGVYNIAWGALILGAVLTLGGTLAVFWASSIRDMASSKEVAAAKATADSARAASATANENTEKLRASNLLLQANVERERTARLVLEAKIAPRHLSQAERNSLINLLRPFKGQKIELVSNIGDQEGMLFANELWSAFRASGWDSPGVSQAVYSPHGPVGIEILINETDADTGRSPAGLAALVDVFFKLGLIPEKRVNKLAQTPVGQIVLRVGSKPP